jgi:hypothetical protein
MDGRQKFTKKEPIKQQTNKATVHAYAVGLRAVWPANGDALGLFPDDLRPQRVVRPLVVVPVDIAPRPSLSARAI